MSVLKNKNQFIAFLLAIVTVALLFAPWVSLSGQTAEDYRDAVQQAKRYSSSADQIIGALTNELGSMFSYELNLPFNGANLKKLAKALLDGKLSAVEMCTLTDMVGNGLSRLEASPGRYLMSSDDRAAMQAAGTVLKAYKPILWATLGVGALLVFFLLLGRKPGPLPAILGILMVILLLYALLFVFGAKYAAEEMGTEIGLRVTLFSLLPLVLLIISGSFRKRALVGGDPVELNIPVAPVAESISKAKSAVAARIPAAASGTAPEKGWRCSCGNLNAEEGQFCSKCGTKRPVVKTCPNCGRQQTEDKPFCGGCGTKL